MGIRKSKIFNIIHKSSPRGSEQHRNRRRIQELEEINKHLNLEIRIRKQKEQLLQISEDRYRSIFENALMGIFQTTPTGDFITVNKAFASIFGYNSPDELIRSAGNTGHKLYAHPEDRLWCIERVRDQGHCTFETQTKRRDGTLGWVLYHVHANPNEYGDIMHYEGFVEDISEKKQALQALQESEECFSTTFRANPAPIILTTVEGGRFIDANEQWLRMMGYTREETIGHTVSELSIWANARTRETMKQKFLDQGFLRGELVQFRTKSGEMKDILWSIEIVKYQGNEVILSLPYDITEHKRVFEEREKLIVELEKALSDVRKLGGLLPICSSCKKIRNDEGYWQQIEVYIKEHSEADFSHGICPDCVKKLYPEFCK